MSIKHRAKLPISGRGFILFLVANFIMELFGNCLRVVDSCVGMEELDYETLQTNPAEFYASTTGNFGNNAFDFNAPSPEEDRIVVDTHSQVNSLLAPKLTAYAKKTPDQKKRAKENRLIRAQKKRTELKRKTADEEKQIELNRKKAKKDLESEVTDLQTIVATMQHPVRGSVQFYANEIVALKIKRAEDAKKSKKQTKKPKTKPKPTRNRSNNWKRISRSKLLQSKHKSGLPRRSTVKHRRKLW